MASMKLHSKTKFDSSEQIFLLRRTTGFVIFQSLYTKTPAPYKIHYSNIANIKVCREIFYHSALF